MLKRSRIYYAVLGNDLAFFNVLKLSLAIAAKHWYNYLPFSSTYLSSRAWVSILTSSSWDSSVLRTSLPAATSLGSMPSSSSGSVANVVLFSSFDSSDILDSSFLSAPVYLVGDFVAVVVGGLPLLPAGFLLSGTRNFFSSAGSLPGFLGSSFLPAAEVVPWPGVLLLEGPFG